MATALTVLYDEDCGVRTPLARQLVGIMAASRRLLRRPVRGGSETVRRLALPMIVVTALSAAAATTAAGGGAPSWTLQLRVNRWVAPSSFAARVTGQTAGLNVRRGLPVTLVMDRRTRCAARDTAGALIVIRCASIRPRLAQHGTLSVGASGQFETGHLGAIGFRARTVTLLS